MLCRTQKARAGTASALLQPPHTLALYLYEDIMIKVAGVLFFTLISMHSHSSVISDTTVTRLMNDRGYTDYTFIQVTGNPSRVSGHCHINGTWDFVLNTSEPFGKQMHAQLLTAFAAGKKVKLEGTDTCPTGNAEELRRIEIY